ncbi:MULTISPECIES: DUF3567 domain-containing protein [Inhella]|uniref:DUF3567 domain-containing protein n=1 Tax=Inhella proteolytica TaxID=2795029 RepID=A0A931J1C5_9BURK|nr:DUF3567 domain-containing protein [Inhella proteolytica]MBH9576923.1 DUF3567 domain-containing protein [Inhella proteolytica]
MHLLYQSASYIVVQFDVPVAEGAHDERSLSRGGFEIVDKFARKEIFIEGALAQQFQEGVEALSEGDPSEEDYDDFIERYANLSQTPVLMH